MNGPVQVAIANGGSILVDAGAVLSYTSNVELLYGTCVLCLLNLSFFELFF